MKKTLITLLVLLSVGEFSSAQGERKSQTAPNKGSAPAPNRAPSSNRAPAKAPAPNRAPAKAPASKPQVTVRPGKQRVVKSIPGRHTPVKFKGVTYYRSGSRYYRKVGGGYSLIAPPRGLRLAILPAIHLAFMFNNARYYCAEGVVYKQDSNGEYEVITPEKGMVIPALPEHNVQEVTINGKVYYEFDEMLYKQVPTQTGLQYMVVGSFSGE